MPNHYKIIENTLKQLANSNFKEPNSLNMVAEKLGLSLFEIQQIFKEWADISVEEYLLLLNTNYTKKLLKNNPKTLFDNSNKEGFSHNLWVNINRMTVNEYKNNGENLCINYSFTESPFGNILMASTQKGICLLTFFDTSKQSISELKTQFPNAKLEQKTDENQQNALLFFQNDWTNLKPIQLHLKATDFQLNVWNALLNIPLGKLTTYGNISQQINNPKAVRALGTAIGSNPVAYLIPCHRVIQSSGKISGYRWKPIRKMAIIGWEMAKTIQQ